MSIVLDGTSGITTNSGTVVSTTDATLNGLTVGKGGGSVSTNTAVGASALTANTSGANNTGNGMSALVSNTTGSRNSAVGRSALGSNDVGTDNSALGYFALQNNTSGTSNTALGVSALQSNTTASNNTAVGYQAGYTGTTGTGNAVFGYQAGYTNLTGGYNAYFGYQAGYTATGTGNSFFGSSAGGLVTTGAGNTFIGNSAGYNMTTGSKNTILGQYGGNQGGLDIRTSNNYIVLSDGDGNPRFVVESSGYGIMNQATVGYQTLNSLELGAPAGRILYSHVSGTASGTLYCGFGYNGGPIGSITQNGTTGVLYNLTSDYRLKNNPVALTGAKDFVMALQPKTWDWWDGSGKGVGFIAHEFMEVAKYSGNGEKDAVDADGKPVYQSIQPSSSEVMANLVAFVQELKALVDAQATEIAQLKAKVA